MGFKAKDIKGLLVLMENEKDGKALAIYGGTECLQKFADALEDKSGSEIMATMEGEPGRFFEMLLKTVKKS